MTADTIHLHHLMFQATNSYIGTLMPIFLVTWLMGVGSVLYYQYSYGFFAMQLFLLILILFVFIPPVPFYVPIVSRFIQRVYVNRTRTSSRAHLLRIRFVPFLVMIYFVSLILRQFSSGLITNLNVYPLVGLAFLLLFTFLRPQGQLSYQVLIAVIVLLQSSLLLGGENMNHFGTLEFARFGSVALLGMITISNYIENSSEFGPAFWSVIDLLVLFIFGALGIMSLNGISVSLLKWIEVVAIYYAGRLYTQRKLKRALEYKNA